MEVGTHVGASSAPALSADMVLRHLRQTIVVIDEVGAILQHEGTSLGVLGYDPGELVGTNALDHVAPEHYDAMLFAFFGPEGRIVRSKHLPFKLGLLSRDGERHDADCCGERIEVDGRQLWVVTLMPHELQPASSQALHGFGAGASSLDIARTVAVSLSMGWDSTSRIRTFLLTDHDGRRFTAAAEPGRSAPDDDLAAAIVAADVSASWGLGEEVHVAIPASDLPAVVADAAAAAGFVAADLAVARLSGQPTIALFSLAGHEHAFAGNIDMILCDAVHTIEATLRRERNEEILVRAAEQDPLTGLANRARFADAFEQSESPTAVLFIDLDGFKQVNDTFGHAVGDAVLIEAARRISQLCRPDDVVTRLGGDEFAILLADVDTPQAIEIGERILAAIAEPLPAGLGPERVRASGGLATAETDASDRIERADLAMLRGKRSGTGRLIVA